MQCFSSLKDDLTTSVMPIVTALLFRRALLLIFCFLALGALPGKAQLYYPPNSGAVWDTLPKSSIGWCTTALEDSLYNYLERTGSKAFMIAKDGRLVVEKYFGTFTRDSNWYWASAGKSLTATLAGIAVRNNQLDINRPSNFYLGNGWTSCTQAQEDAILVKHQLSMTTGLEDNVVDPNCTLPTCLRYREAPDRRWAYHNGAYTMLDGVLTAATNQTLNQQVLIRLTAPTGFSGAFFRQGYNNVFVSKARELMRFGLLIQGYGKWRTVPVVDSTWVVNMLQPSNVYNPSYGYLWWLNYGSSFMTPGIQLSFPGPMMPHAPADMYAALGKNGQTIMTSRSKGIIVLRIGNNTDNSLVPISYANEIWRRMNLINCTTSLNGTSQSSRPEITQLGQEVRVQGLDLHTDAEIKWQLYNCVGQRVQSTTTAGTEPLRLDGTLPTGTYYLAAEGVEWAVRGKILVTRP